MTMPKGRHGLELKVVEGRERLPEGWSSTEGGRMR